MRIEQIMCREVVCVGPHEAVEHARRVLDERDIQQVPVVQGQRLIGMLSRQDIRMPLDWPEVIRWMDELEIESFMRRNPPTLPPSATAADAAALMCARSAACVAVVKDDRLVGLLTRGDLLRALVPVLVEPPHDRSRLWH